MHTVHELARQTLLDQVCRQPGVDRHHVGAVRLHRPVTRDLAGHQHVLGPELELPGPHGVTMFQRLELCRGALRHGGAGPGRILAVTLAQRAQVRLPLQPDQVVIRARHFHDLGVHFGGQDI